MEPKYVDADKYELRISLKDNLQEKDVLVHTVHGATREESVVKQWLTKERIEELKEEFIERIRKSKNPFSVYVGDTDCYQMPEDKLFEPKSGWGVTEGLIRDHAYYEMQHSQSESLFGVGGNKLRPCYFDEVIFGDGLLLIYFTTYDDRPDYWLVRVDSSCADDPSKLDENEILSAIASWLGSYEQGQERDEEMGAAICSNSTPLWGVLIDFKKGVDRNGQPLKEVPHIPWL